MTRSTAPSDRLLIAATALALHRGGMVDCAPLINCLRDGLGGILAAPDADLDNGADGPDGALCGVVTAAMVVVEAHRHGDQMAFDEAKCRLWAKLAKFWSGVALAMGMRAAP